MRPMGLSTGALAKGNFRAALLMLQQIETTVVELSALRQAELPGLLDTLDQLDLSQFTYVSVHAPSSIQSGTEEEFTNQLARLKKTDWPIVVHPDTIQNFDLWSQFGKQLCIENNDLRKPTGRTVSELDQMFSALPEATFCCDLGHARQVDPTMTEATRLLNVFGGRLQQLHLSEVNTKGRHERISLASVKAFAKIYHLIPDHVPVVLETPISPNDIQSELDQARAALPPQRTIEGSLDILWANYQSPDVAPEYRLHFLRYVNFRNGPQRSKAVVGRGALSHYLSTLNFNEQHTSRILVKVDEEKAFDVPNVMMPESEYEASYAP